ncbi:hypothetical protein [Psychrilyobacter sp.]|uniref:hypothetical protein n=1 Tax=Psychrilyobacter sp. TaxID=2586924 RepID=UPI0030191E22
MLKIILAIVVSIILVLLILKDKKKGIINYVFINQKTKKYHQKKCPYAKNLKSISFEAAIKEDYTPCKICNEEKN